MKPIVPRIRVYLEGVGWLCNKEVDSLGCRKIKDHKGSCKHTLAFWDLVKRQFRYGQSYYAQGESTMIFGKTKKNTASITINNKIYKGNDVVIKNGKVIVDGKEVCTSNENLILTINGSPVSIKTDRSVEVFGNVEGDMNVGGSVRCDSVGRNVDAGGSVKCGNVNGNVNTGGSITCENIQGDADAGGSITSR